jgi:hypothetical protein
MDEMLTLDDRSAEQDRRIAQAVAREGLRHRWEPLEEGEQSS